MFETPLKDPENMILPTETTSHTFMAALIGTPSAILAMIVADSVLATIAIGVLNLIGLAGLKILDVWIRVYLEDRARRRSEEGKK